MSEFMDANGSVTSGETWNGGAPMHALPPRKNYWKGLAMCGVGVIVVAVVAVFFLRSLTMTYGVWASNVTPKVTSSSDTQGVELGMKFQAAVSGKITGVRFYKGTQNTGTHTGTLWDKYGNKLASVTFKNESASGWQTASFKTPVSVAGNVTYVVSYYAPNGHNSVDVNYFNKAFTNKRLTALNDGWDGTNGLFGFGTSSVFPMHSASASNYWVEPLFASKVFGASVTPSAPVAFHATPQAKSVLLSWLPSVSARPIKQYDIYRDGTLIKTIANTAPSTTTSYHLGVTPAQRIAALTTPANKQVAFSLSSAHGFDAITLASTTTVNNSASNKATGTNDVNSTNTNTTVNNGTTTTTTTPTTTGTTTPVNTSADAPATATTPVATDYYTFNDKSVTPGKTYTYQVKAVDTANQTSDVSKTTATVGGNGVKPSSTPSTTTQNGGVTTVNNTANNTATGANDTSGTTTKTTVNNGTTTTTTTPTTTGTGASTTPTTTTTTPAGSGTTTSGGSGSGTTNYGSSLGNTATGANQSSSSSAVWQYQYDNTDWSQYFNDLSGSNVNGSGSGSGSGSSTGLGTHVTNSNTGDKTSTTTTTNGGTTTINNSSSSSAH